MLKRLEMPGFKKRVGVGARRKASDSLHLGNMVLQLFSILNSLVPPSSHHQGLSFSFLRVIHAAQASHCLKRVQIAQKCVCQAEKLDSYNS